MNQHVNGTADRSGKEKKKHTTNKGGKKYMETHAMEEKGRGKANGEDDVKSEKKK